jgi:cytoskeletal protein RodZ
MAYIAKRQKKARPVKKLLLLLCGVIIVLGVPLLLEFTGVTHIFRKGIPATKIIVTAGKPAPATQPKKSTGGTTQPEKSPTANTSINQGTAVDNHGTQDSTDSSQWITSKSGNIIVKQPAANAKITKGSILAGSAKVGQVQYRLIDNSVGVIAQGTLSVANGNYSGALQFQPYSAGGRLDVFSFDEGGAEINEIQIGVTF